MNKVEYFGISTNQKLNYAWNYSSIMVAYIASIFQLKVRQNHHNKGPKRDAKEKQTLLSTQAVPAWERESERMEWYLLNQWWQEKNHPQPGQAEVLSAKWLMLLQLPTQSKTCHSTDYHKIFN